MAVITNFEKFSLMALRFSCGEFMKSVSRRPYYNSLEVFEKAKGRWLEILACFAGGQLDQALVRPGRSRMTCPFHGTSKRNGKGDGFRLFQDTADNGSSVCNSCGTFKADELLMKLNGWDYNDFLEKVGSFLGVQPHPYKTHPPSSIVVPLQKGPRSSQNEHSPRAPSSVPTSQSADASSVAVSVPPLSHVTEARMAEIRKLQEALAARNKAESSQIRSQNKQLWLVSRNLRAGYPKPMFRYLARRNVLVKSNAMKYVRFHPALEYFEKNEEDKSVLVGKFPAIVAAITDLDGQVQSLHRTFLGNQGNKAPVADARKMCRVPDDRDVMGAAIQLGGPPIKGVLGVGEGMETALSPFRVYGMPTWSTVSASMLAGFVPPAEVDHLFIWADLDASFTGENVAESLAERARDLSIVPHIMLPNRSLRKGRKTIDWNDVLRSEGLVGFPSFRHIMKLISKPTVFLPRL